MAISEALYSSKTDMWETPQELFDELDLEFHFDLDCALLQKMRSARNFTRQSRTD